jgi:hypothetical protein
MWKGADTMKTNQPSSSKEQELQALKNKQRIESTKEVGQIDKKLEGPNIPSV